jgi:hypothetical protein
MVILIDYATKKKIPYYLLDSVDCAIFSVVNATAEGNLNRPYIKGSRFAIGGLEWQC